MKKIALIPARYASTRFPGKLMQILGNKTVILTTYQATLNTGLFDQVFVVTDSDLIFDEIVENGGNAIKSNGDFECGTDRIAAAAKELTDADIIVNVQGDEPFTNKEALSDLLAVFENEPQTLMASLMHQISDLEAIENPNNVKVVVDKFSNALLFSRSVIPFHRNKDKIPVYYKHIGIYAFRRKMLMDFANMPPTPLESTEQLEGLRYLENGIKLKMVLANEGVIGIDTKSDLEQARNYLKQKI